jgi:hypothetical protein
MFFKKKKKSYSEKFPEILGDTSWGIIELMFSNLKEGLRKKFSNDFDELVIESDSLKKESLLLNIWIFDNALKISKQFPKEFREKVMHIIRLSYIDRFCDPDKVLTGQLFISERNKGYYAALDEASKKNKLALSKLIIKNLFKNDEYLNHLLLNIFIQEFITKFTKTAIEAFNDMEKEINAG